MTEPSGCLPGKAIVPVGSSETNTLFSLHHPPFSKSTDQIAKPSNPPTNRKVFVWIYFYKSTRFNDSHLSPTMELPNHKTIQPSNRPPFFWNGIGKCTNYPYKNRSGSIELRFNSVSLFTSPLLDSGPNAQNFPEDCGFPFLKSCINIIEPRFEPPTARGRKAHCTYQPWRLISRAGISGEAVSCARRSQTAIAHNGDTSHQCNRHRTYW